MSQYETLVKGGYY